MGIRILVIHGAGLELRGKVDVHIFGPMTMAEYSAAVEGFAMTLGIQVEIFHSVDPSVVVAKLKSCKAAGVNGVLINPGNFTIGHPELAAALKDTALPSVEVHLSNPANRSVVSQIAPVTTSAVAGFGIQGYLLGLTGLRDKIRARSTGSLKS